MIQLAKRAQLIYKIFQEQISQMDFSKKGEERVEEFLKAIDFENASEVTRRSLLVIEKQHLRALKIVDVFHALESTGIYYGWTEYYLRLQSDFRRWSHCDEVRKVSGKPTGSTDLFRLYQYVWNTVN